MSTVDTYSSSGKCLVILRNAIWLPILNLPQSTYAHPCCRLSAPRRSPADLVIFRNSLGNAVRVRRFNANAHEFHLA